MHSESTAKKASFEWSNYGILYTEQKVIATFRDSSTIHSGGKFKILSVYSGYKLVPNQLNDLSFSFQRLSSCAHGFVSFDIISAPDRTAHGHCVNIPGQSQSRKTVGMAVPPSLHHCAKGLDIRVIEHFIRIREDHPSVEKMVVILLSFLLFKG